MYPFMFILICLFGYVNAECLIDTLPQETTSSAPELCRDPNPSTCEDFKEWTVSPAEYIEKDGCFMLTCPENTYPSFFSQFQYSEIPPPGNLIPQNALEISPPTSLEEMGGASLSEYFGIICDDGVWKLTKYPNGITFNKDPPSYTNGSLNGYKTEIFTMNCY
ncbi:DUF281 domain-containing protein [Caenorhabditis elegans]|uniref:DUF281 domain-containing protein n=1 Tax=Caenorhabditis elegans TaxID=6239 RepID=Q9U5B1_CAEEL|nr:DUF281 domain-containing protein [Caenorhabditis elegans]CCD69625.2 DUF281 domain-containing protein [Caenorhabditis elegans]|eukprot:NP_494255.3 Uncharacterized protein CELE_F43C11.12 [Caenorhabditis elegans]